MKGITIIVLFQLILAIIAAYLIAQMSFFGKIGISLFYKEYGILKNPLFTGILIFSIEMLVIGILQFLHSQTNRLTRNMVALLFLVFAVIGLIYTYFDFTEEFSHKILKSKFHLGVYLVWIGIMVSALFYLFKSKHILYSS